MRVKFVIYKDTNAQFFVIWKNSSSFTVCEYSCSGALILLECIELKKKHASKLHISFLQSTPHVICYFQLWSECLLAHAFLHRMKGYIFNEIRRSRFAYENSNHWFMSNQNNNNPTSCLKFETFWIKFRQGDWISWFVFRKV